MKLNPPAGNGIFGANASGLASSGLPRDFRLHCARQRPGPDRSAGNRENWLLREDETRGHLARLRAALAEAGPGQTMLRTLLSLLCPSRHGGRAVCLSAGRRRKIRRVHFLRAAAFGPSSRSAAARLISLPRRLVPLWRGENNGTQQEDSMKYLLMILTAVALMGTASATSQSADDCCGGGACCLIKTGCCAK